MTAKEVRNTRKRLGWSVVEFAAHLDVSRATIYAWESGVRTPCCKWMRIELRRLRDKSRGGG